MDVLTRSNIPSAFWPGVRNIFGMNYREAEQVCRRIVKVRGSTRAEEKSFEMIGLGLIPEQKEAEPYKIDKLAEGMHIYARHVGYGLGVVISREAIKDNLYGKYIVSGTRSLLRSTRQTIEIVAHAPLNKAFDTTAEVGDSGVPLLSASHPSVSDGLQSNVLATPAALSELALEMMITQMAIARDQRGLQLNFKPTKLVIHPENRFRSGRLLMSNQQPNTFSNNVNVIKHDGLIPEVVTTPYLQDQKSFYLLTDADEPAMVMYEREGYQVSEYTDPRSGAVETSVYFRISSIANDWHGIYGAQGA